MWIYLGNGVVVCSLFVYNGDIEDKQTIGLVDYSLSVVREWGKNIKDKCDGGGKNGTF